MYHGKTEPKVDTILLMIGIRCHTIAKEHIIFGKKTHILPDGSSINLSNEQFRC